MNETLIETMTDEQFRCWLAGFFDGEGCITLNEIAKHSVDITIATTTEGILDAIQKRMQVGIMARVVYSNPKWKPKFTLRIRNYAECSVFINFVYPFLIIKRNVARMALDRFKSIEDETQYRRDRMAEIKRLKSEGVTAIRIAEMFGITDSAIYQICRRGVTKKFIPVIDRSYIREHKESTVSKHTSDFPSTKSEITSRVTAKQLPSGDSR